VEDLSGFHGISGGFRGLQGTSGALKIWPGLTASLKCHLHLCGFGAAPMASSLLSLTTLPACNSQLATCNSCCSDPPFPRIGLLYKACTFLFLCFFFSSSFTSLGAFVCQNKMPKLKLFCCAENRTEILQVGKGDSGGDSLGECISRRYCCCFVWQIV